MKQFLITVAIGGLIAPSMTLAQDGVTIYGIVDAAVRSVDNEGRGSMVSLVSGSASTSRFGLRGVEDLGQGMSAGFDLEHGLLADTGTTASSQRFWDRRATVSLKSKSIGELRLGRDFVPSYRNWSRYDPFAYVGVARTSDFFSGSATGPIKQAFGADDNTVVRADNAVQYLLPALGGIEGEVMVAAGEGGDVQAGRAKVVGLRLGYAGKAFDVSAATMSSENKSTTGSKFKDSAVGGHVKLANVDLSAAWRQLSVFNAKQTNVLLGVKAGFGAHVIRASWQRVDMDGTIGATDIGSVGATKLGLGYIYLLSKRTNLYASAARITNRGKGKFSIPGGPSGLSEGAKSTGFESGLIHRF